MKVFIYYLKKVLVLAALVCILCGIGRFCNIQTQGFTQAKICSTLSFNPEWETSSPEETKNYFNTTFHYIGRGAQVFAFASKDGKSVLKFLRHHRKRHYLASLVPYLPSFLKKGLLETIAKRKTKLLEDFSSYKLAHDYIPEETGILFLHLNKTTSLNKTIKIYDNIGVEHKIDLDKMEFILQKKAEPFYSTLEKWIWEGDIEKAKAGILSLVDLLKKRGSLGLLDKDPNLESNFGFFEDKVVQIDIGRFRKAQRILSPKEKEDELIRITDPLAEWLNYKSGELYNYLQHCIHG